MNRYPFTTWFYIIFPAVVVSITSGLLLAVVQLTPPAATVQPHPFGNSLELPISRGWKPWTNITSIDNAIRLSLKYPPHFRYEGYQDAGGGFLFSSVLHPTTEQLYINGCTPYRESTADAERAFPSPLPYYNIVTSMFVDFDGYPGIVTELTLNNYITPAVRRLALDNHRDIRFSVPHANINCWLQASMQIDLPTLRAIISSLELHP